MNWVLFFSLLIAAALGGYLVLLELRWRRRPQRRPEGACACAQWQVWEDEVEIGGTLHTRPKCYSSDEDEYF